MAVALDAVSTVTAASSIASFSWTHTPSGTPTGVLVVIPHYAVNASVSSLVTGISYGGAALASVVATWRTAAEYGGAEAWFLGTGVPSGNATVVVNFASTSTAWRYGAAFTFTGSSLAVRANITVLSTSYSTQTYTLALSGTTCVVVLPLFSANNDVITYVTPRTGWTDRGRSDGGQGGVGVFSYDTVDSADVLCGFTQVADETAWLAVGIGEGSAVSIGGGILWSGIFGEVAGVM